MTEVSNGNRQRPASPGLDGVDELWSRLRDATKEAKLLATTNRQLVAQVRSLERQLVKAGALSDDELVAELPRRMTRALESAQEVAEELVGRAKKREEIIRQRTDQRASALISQAEAEATAMLRRAAQESVARVKEAQTQAEAILRTARARHEQVVAALQEQSAMLEERVRRLGQTHDQLVRAYDVVERTLGEARASLRSAAELAGAPPQVVSQDSHGVRQNPTASSGQLYAIRDGDAAVYDWSPPASGTA